MGVKTIHNLVIATPGKDGATNWVKHGVLMEMDDGRMAVKLESLPIGVMQDRDKNAVPWDGWFKVFEQKDDRSSGGGTQSRTQNQSRPRALDNDDIPF